MKKSVKIILIILIILIVGVLICCFIFNNKKDNNIYGLWSVDGTTKYEFKQDGEGEMILPLHTYSFNYQLNDNILSIDFVDDKVTDNTYSVSINDNELLLTEVNGNNSFKFYREN